MNYSFVLSWNTMVCRLVMFETVIHRKNFLNQNMWQVTVLTGRGDLPLSTPTTPDMQFIFARLTLDNLAAPSTWEFHANGMQMNLPIFKVQLLNDLAEPPVVAPSTLEGPGAFYQHEIPKLEVQQRLCFVKLANLNGVYRASAVKRSRSAFNRHLLCASNPDVLWVPIT